MTDPLLPPVVQLLEVAPIFLVDDLTGATEHYRERLGFNSRVDSQAVPPTATASRDGIAIVLRQRDDASGPRAAGGRAVIWVADLESLSIELRLRGAELLDADDPRTGVRPFRVRDLDGNELHFDQLVH